MESPWGQIQLSFSFQMRSSTYSEPLKNQKLMKIIGNRVNISLVHCLHGKTGYYLNFVSVNNVSVMLFLSAFVTNLDEVLSQL